MDVVFGKRYSSEHVSNDFFTFALLYGEKSKASVSNSGGCDSGLLISMGVSGMEVKVCGTRELCRLIALFLFNVVFIICSGVGCFSFEGCSGGD